MLRHGSNPPRLLLVRSCVALFAAMAAGAASCNEPEVLPLLTSRCAECHGSELSENGLQVTSWKHLVTGGDSGPALSPGSASESLLFKRIAAGEMPPEHPLEAGEVEAVRAWIDSLPRSLSPASDATAERVSVPAVMTRVFFTHCISCHGKHKQEAGLDLRTPESIRRGGKSGPAVVPRDPDGSLIIRRLIADEMPPKKNVLGDDNYVRRVAPDEIDLVRRWIAAGAPDEKATGDVNDEAPPARSDFWSFQPVKRPAVATVKQQRNVVTPIDSFIVAQLEPRGLSLSPPAEKLELLRRACFDLTGLPPTPAEVNEYLADNRPDAYERLIDRFLASPHYGERWAQHWLDGAGYSDSHGKIDRDQFRAYLWRYRDYVIRAFNADKPYDRFLTEQIAGDELVATGELASDAEQIEALIATGFLLTAADATDEAAFNTIAQRMGVVADQIDIFTSSVMGLTLECARCHNHKFDPITQQDYYRFSAIFQSAMDPYDWRIASQMYYPRRIPLDRCYQRYIYYPADKESPELARWNNRFKPRIEELGAKLAALLKERQEAARAAGDAESAKLDADQWAAKDPKFKERLEKLRSQLNSTKQQLIEPGVIDGLTDVGGEPTPVYQLRRGELNSPGERVAPGVPSTFDGLVAPYTITKPSADSQSSGNRLALARWLTDKNHPLTARVIVNRVWQHHFGQGLVATPGNFGAKGARPSHPELLDWLASELVDNGWSLKKLHKLIMTSAVYRQTSRVSGESTSDSDNVLLSHFPMQRLDGESIRDAILAVSGQLDLTPYGPPEEVERTPEGEVVDPGAGSRRRSIYLRRMRLKPLTVIEQFDGPDMVPNCLGRTQSNVPTQALELYNSDFVRSAATAFAKELLKEKVPGEPAVREVYIRAFGRPPNPGELQQALSGLGDLRDAWGKEAAIETAANNERKANLDKLALATFCHAVLNSPEFIYVD
jgi:mono/diheme cytochrome c family protein